MKQMMVLPSPKGARPLKRGDVYYADLWGIEQSLGSEQTGRRPVLIIQNDVGNKYSPTTIVAIMTTKLKAHIPTHVIIHDFEGLSQPSAVCLEQIKTIDKSRLENYCGNIGKEKMDKVERAISISIGAKDISCYEAEKENIGVERRPAMELVRKDTVFENQQNDWLQLAKDQMMFFSDIKQHMTNLELEKRKLEEENEDILDYIESTNYNVAQGYKIYRMLRERRKRRNEVIAELMQLTALTEAFNCEQLKKMYQNAIAKMESVKTEKRKSAVVQEIMELEVS